VEHTIYPPQPLTLLQGLLWTGAQANGATSSSGSLYLSHTPPGRCLQTLLVAAASSLRLGAFLTLSSPSQVASYEETLEPTVRRGSRH